MSGLFELFRAAGADHPRRPALVIDGRSLSYEELLDLSLRAAAGLRGRAGIRRGSRVAVWAPKRMETYVGVYGALAAGAAYVPIDLTAPAARAAWIVENAGAEVLICRAFDFGQLPRPLPPELKLVVLLDGEAPGTDAVPTVTWSELVDSAPAGFQEEDAGGTDLAYILYTSGSTGTPKGVAISHGASRAFVDWAGDLCGLGPEDRVSNHAALSFDLSVFDLFSTARAGAALHPLPQWPAGQGYPFARFIAERAITVWYSVPTLLSRIATSQEKKPLDLGSLRVVIFAGEVFPKPKLVQFRGIVPAPRLLNWYGPTETNVCLSHEVGPEDLRDEDPLPIGQPCPFSEVVVDDPVDGQGELWVAGGSLMEGYWRSGRVDGSVFRTVEGDPRRFYPTGDLVSRGADGVFRFHGRRDSQVKLHGYRIELGEIEEALEALPRVVEAAVVCSADDLFAFVATGDPESSDSSEIATLEQEAREHLTRVLPSYMVPRTIRLCGSLPRTDRGKIDRGTLLRSLQSESPAAHA